MLARLAHYEVEWWDWYRKNPTEWPTVYAGLLRNEERRARILGLDKMMLKVKTEDDGKIPLSALRALLARAEAVEEVAELATAALACCKRVSGPRCRPAAQIVRGRFARARVQN